MDATSSQLESHSDTLSRRDVLGGGIAAAAVASAAIEIGGSSATAQAAAVLTGTMAGRRYRALVHSPGEGSSVQELRMLPLGPDHVVVRTQASFLSYDKCQAVLYPPGKNAVGVGSATIPIVLGDGGVGIVEAVGSRVRRVNVGDRVIVQDSPYCGTCYDCLHGRPDRCQLGGPAAGGGKGSPFTPVAETEGGTQVIEHNNGGGFAELMIAYEWYCQPIFADAPSPALSPLISEAACGLGMAFGVAPVEPGSSVCVIGCGAVGLAAVQGARIKGASRIIAVDPIAYRRESALKLGATDALDPFGYFKKSDLAPIPEGGGGGAAGETDALVLKIRDMCRGRTDRPFAGGRYFNLNGNSDGPDYVMEAAGGDVWPPASGPSPDPTGVLPLQQAWKLNSTAGQLCTCAVNQRGYLGLPAVFWSNARKSHHPGNMNGVNPMRDMQRYAILTETGQFNGSALVPGTCTLDTIREMYLRVATRSIIGASLVFPD
jgi:Zn-dependent alcohol dehydrogenase